VCVVTAIESENDQLSFDRAMLVPPAILLSARAVPALTVCGGMIDQRSVRGRGA
jgi:hypothetical protein